MLSTIYLGEAKCDQCVSALCWVRRGRRRDTGISFYGQMPFNSEQTQRGNRASTSGHMPFPAPTQINIHAKVSFIYRKFQQAAPTDENEHYKTTGDKYTTRKIQQIVGSIMIIFMGNNDIHLSHRIVQKGRGEGATETYSGDHRRRAEGGGGAQNLNTHIQGFSVTG